MKYLLALACITGMAYQMHAQSFVRTELPTEVNRPWEITYGPDDYLWLTEKDGKVIRVHPETGAKTVVFTASDYFDGSPLEDLDACTNPSIGKGTLGLALDPDFTNPDYAFIYYVYSYNSGTSSFPSTKFRIKRLKWDANTATVVADTNLVDSLANGHAHQGGRLLAVKYANTSFLYLSIGDHGISELSSPECYIPQSTNPNNFAQDVTTQNGKIHRFNIDGSIPFDNPIAGNSFYTRGHRNPQGLMYNPSLGLVYDIEHGDFADDEINILYKGMNYGWKDVRGYHDDETIQGEADYVANYVPHPNIANDSLVEAFYSWCTDVDTTDPTNNSLWCTVAPSGGAYYGSDAIPEWSNSLLVVTLKDGLTVDREVYQFRLTEGGELALSTENHPNPTKFFGEDQALNGRLRDIAISNDGKKIFLVSNAGIEEDKITVYTYDPDTGIGENDKDAIIVYPNPVKDILYFSELDKINNFKSLQITDISGKLLFQQNEPSSSLAVNHLAPGVYIVKLISGNSIQSIRFVKQ